MRSRKRNSDESLRALERRVFEGKDRDAVIQLARVLERHGMGGGQINLWAVVDDTVGESPRVMGIWPSEDEAVQDAARCYVEILRVYDMTGHDVVFVEEDAEDPLDFDDEEFERHGPVTKREIFDLFAAGGDYKRVIERAEDFVRRARRTKHGFSFAVQGPIVLGKFWEFQK